MVSKKFFIKYDMLKNYMMNLVISLICLPTHVTRFIVIAKKPVVSVLLKENARCTNFAVYFLQKMD